MASRGRGSNIKGSKRERFISKALSKWSGQRVLRTLESGAGSNRAENETRMTGDLFYPVGSNNVFSFEVKDHKATKLSHVFLNGAQISSFWQQAVTDCRKLKGRTPMLIFHVDHKSDYCVFMYNEKFLHYLQTQKKIDLVKVRLAIQYLSFVDLQGRTQLFPTMLMQLKDLVDYVPYETMNKLYTDFNWEDLVQYSKGKKILDTTQDVVIDALNATKEIN